jgi:hypothetical protein
MQNPGLEISAAGKLIDTALQVFIGGYYHRICLPPDVKLEKPTPETCLSQLVPNMFNPGYREVPHHSLTITKTNESQIMAYNFRFLPGIVRFTANPLPEHLQPPFLKEKMAQLAAMPISPIPGYDTSPSMDTNEHITRVVETRLFTMMQQKLYDPIATRKVWKKAKDEIDHEGPRDENEDPELLDLDESPAGNNEWDDLLARFTSDEEFNDLLFGEDEGDEDDDLLDEAERERLEIERQTDEMLFGDGGYKDEDEEKEDPYILSGGESEGENMLV